MGWARQLVCALLRCGELPSAGTRPDDETVALYLAALEGELEAERARADSLRTRATGLIALLGVVMAVFATAAVDAVNVKITGAPRDVMLALAAAGSVLLIVTAVLLLVGVVKPSPLLGLADAEIKYWATPEAVRTPPTEARGSLLVGLTAVYIELRRRNDRLASIMRASTYLTVVGIGMLLTCAAILAWHEA